MFFLCAINTKSVDFTYIYEKYNRLVYHIAYGILQNSHNAEDAAAETFLRLAKYKHRLKGLDHKAMKVYIAAAARNTALDMSRKTLEIPSENIGEMAEAIEVDTFSYNELMETVASLPEKQKTVFLYKYGWGLSIKEIADILGDNTNTVKVNLYRARKRLAAMLKEDRQ